MSTPTNNNDILSDFDRLVGNHIKQDANEAKNQHQVLEIESKNFSIEIPKLIFMPIMQVQLLRLYLSIYWQQQSKRIARINKNRIIELERDNKKLKLKYKDRNKVQLI